MTEITSKQNHDHNQKIAVLIDGDNASYATIENVLSEVGKYGEITLKRIYGDWSKSDLRSWNNAILNHAIQPVQQIRYAKGKNSTDCAMIIDAMDILHGGSVEGFCLVSSDSDYTRLVIRLREEGLFVMGVGEAKTPKPLVNACNVFVYTENLVKVIKETRKMRPKKATQKKVMSTTKIKDPEPIPMLKKAIDSCMMESGWAYLSEIGIQLQKLDPGFDPRTYGHKKLLSLFEEYPEIFEVRTENDKPPYAVYYVRFA